MKKRLNIFLTVFLGSAIVGVFMASELSPGFDSSLSTVEDLDLGEDRVSLSTSCFKLDLNATTRQVAQIDKFSNPGSSEFDSPYNLAVRMAEASGKPIEYVEIKSVEKDRGAELVLDDVKSTKVDSNPVDAVIIAAYQDIPVLVEKEFMREQGQNICLAGSIEI